MDSAHSYFLSGQMDRNLIYRPNHSGETWLSQEEVYEEYNTCLVVHAIYNLYQR
jgi:hypothetical protein